MNLDCKYGSAIEVHVHVHRFSCCRLEQSGPTAGCCAISAFRSEDSKNRELVEKASKTVWISTPKSKLTALNFEELRDVLSIFAVIMPCVHHFCVVS